jgi:glycosyltransferase involved in cell wall biosynthesis
MKLSVIIPVWNTGENAAKLVKNLLGQYDDLEIIAVDDGSTDDSLQKLEEVSRSSLAQGRVKVVHQENAGASAARNTGIRMARGEYSCFLDSDDEIKDGMLKKMVEKMDQNPQLAISTVGMEYRKLAQGRVENTYVSPRRERRRNESRAEYMLYLLLLDGRMYGVINKLFRTKIVQENKLEFEVGRTFAEDTNFVLDYLRYAPGEFSFILEPLYIYNYGTETSTVKKSATEWKNWQESYDYLKKWVKDTDGMSLRSRILLQLVKARWRVSHLRSKRRARG